MSVSATVGAGVTEGAMDGASSASTQTRDGARLTANKRGSMLMDVHRGATERGGAVFSLSTSLTS
jgi:hypothetical protein